MIKKNDAEFLTIKTKLVYVLILSMMVGIKPQMSFNGHTLKITLQSSFKIPIFTYQKLYPFIQILFTIFIYKINMYSILIIFTYINILYNLIISKCIFKPIIQNLDDNLKM